MGENKCHCNLSAVYLGFNSFKGHKRGVENVIDNQASSFNFRRVYYVHFGDSTSVYKYKKFICISLKRTWWWPLIINSIIYRIQKSKELVVHSHNYLMTVVLFKRTDIFTVHDGLFYLKKMNGARFLSLFKLIEKVVYTRSGVVHYISRFAKSQSLISDDKAYVVIPNTSHLEQFCGFLSEQPINDNKKCILSVRSIEERARIDLVIEVARSLVSEEFRFIIAGKGPLLDHYKNFVSTEKITNVVFLGYVSDSDLVLLYKSCDAVLITSEYGEGFGLPIIEAYLFNKPVIASDRCAIPDVIINSGFLFNNDVSSIKNKIKVVFESELPDFRAYYKNRFSNKIVLSEYRKLYHADDRQGI